MVARGPSITVSGLAKYIQQPSAAQRAETIADYKYPPEVVRKYYREALRIIRLFYKEDHSTDWLVEEATELDVESAFQDSVGAKRRMEYNALVIRNFAKHYSGRQLNKVTIPQPMVYKHGGLDVRVSPNVAAIERTQPRIMILQFAKSKDPIRHAKIISQVLLEAVPRTNLSSSAIRVWDCRTCEEYVLNHVSVRLSKEINAACEEIVNQWDHI